MRKHTPRNIADDETLLRCRRLMIKLAERLEARFDAVQKAETELGGKDPLADATLALIQQLIKLHALEAGSAEPPDAMPDNAQDEEIITRFLKRYLDTANR